MKNVQVSLVTMYAKQMEEVKSRLAIVSGIVEGKFSLNREDFDYEVASLHLRKVLELVAFSSLIVSKQKYESAYKNFDKHYKAKAILNDIEKIHPNFFPKPIQIELIKPGFHHVSEVSNGSLSKEEFAVLYDLCAKVMHVWNPFNSDPRFINFIYSLAEWVRKIQRLLSTHYIQLVDETYWIVVMQDPKDGRVHVYPSAPVDGQELKEMPNNPEKTLLE